jgi:DNA ligase-1
MRLPALTGELNLPAVKAAAIRGITEERIDPTLFYMSWDYVGDLAETVALLWPKAVRQPPEIDDGTLRISSVVERLASLGRSEAPQALAGMLDHLDASGRYALLKLATGELRIGVSARLAKLALAEAFGLDVDAVEEVWHGIGPPYLPLFAWAEGKGDQPTARNVPVFRPFMLAHALEDLCVSMHDYAAEWKWDGIRVQIVRVAGETRLYSRAGDDITRSFPEVAAAFDRDGVLDGELLVRGEFQGADEHGGAAASFNALQQRLGRKIVSAKMLSDYPAFVRLYDMLLEGAEDLRPLPWSERRARLEAFRSEARSGAVRPLRADRGIDLRGARADPRRHPRRRDRGRDAEAAGQPLCGRPPSWPVVQVEARSADRRLRADVRRAGERQAIQLLLRLHIRLLERGGRAASRRQGLFRLHR